MVWKLVDFKGCTLTNCTRVHAGAKQPPLGESTDVIPVSDIGCPDSVFLVVPLFCSLFASDPIANSLPTTYRHYSLVILTKEFTMCSWTAVSRWCKIYTSHATFGHSYTKESHISLKLKFNSISALCFHVLNLAVLQLDGIFITLMM